MKIQRGNKTFRRFGIGLAAFLAVFGLVMMNLPRTQAAGLNKKYSYIKTNYTVPTSNVKWVAPDGNDSTGNGTESAPYATFKKALSTLSAGGTVVAKTGIYREPHFYIPQDNMTLQAAPGAEVWLKGSVEVANSAWSREGSMWKTTGDYTSFCHVCTVNPDSAKEGMAAYPEQVFINDQPLRQVATKAEVTAGTFYVEDATPTTMKIENGKRVYTPGAKDPITYYLGSDPTAGVTEIANHARAFTVAKAGFTMKGINIAQYSPVQEWGFTDPNLEQTGTSMVFVSARDATIQDSIFAQSASVALNLANYAGIVVKNNTFIDNGANGAGANRTIGAEFVGNTFTSNNQAGFNTTDCGAYCTVSEFKTTHNEGLVFRENIVDNSTSGIVQADADSVVGKKGGIGFWCDEGCIDAKIVNNFFTNIGTAIFYEVSGPGIIASNIIENSGTGVRIAASNDVKLYNNTISRTNRPIYLFEDKREDGCNAYSGTTCTSQESWSVQKGLSWNLTGLEMYNNIISSRAYKEKDSSRPYWSYPVFSQGAENWGAKATKIYTDQMFKGFDYNVYYRSNLTNEPYMFTWDLDGGYTIDIQFARAADISKETRISQSIEGRDANSFDTFGTREANPYFMKEAAGNADYNQSNYNLKAGSPAIASGKPLPADVAQAIDPTGQTVKAGVAVNRGALLNAKMDATGGQESPEVSDNVYIPDANLKAALNKLLADKTGTARDDAQEITKEEIKKLSTLSLSVSGDAPESEKIKDITGLEEAVNATWISLDGNAVTDLTPVQNLTKLVGLTIPSNKVSSIEPVRNLQNLQTFTAYNNKLQSLEPLSGLTRLVTVGASAVETPIDMGIFANSASTLTNLQIYDYPRTTKVANFDEITKLTALKKLRLSGVELTPEQLQTIGTMTGLTSLRLDSNVISDISPLKNLTNLTELNLENQVVKLSSTSESFASPLKDTTGATVAITDGDLVNDADVAGNIKVASPIFDGTTRTLEANWSKSVTIGSATGNFSGEIRAAVTLPATNLDQLRAQVDRANSQPSYIKNDANVAAALTNAQNILNKTGPSEGEVSAATANLKQALDAAIQKEADAQAAARAAVDVAKNSGSPADISAAEAKLANVQDPTKKSEMQNELNQIKQSIADARSALSSLIDKAQNASTDGMTAASTSALQSEIASAQQVIGNQNATLAELNSAKDKLQEKLDALRADKTNLEKAIADAEREPDYIKNQSAVKQALDAAKNVQNAANPTPTEVKAATDNLNKAITDAKKAEADAQAAARTAVDKAKSDKTAQSKADAQALVDKVGDPQVKANLQRELDAIVVLAATNKLTVPQTSGSLTINTSGDACYNISDGRKATAPQNAPNGFELRETVEFKVDCVGVSAQTGYSTKITLELTKKYGDNSALKVLKYNSSGSGEVDITDSVAFGVNADGSRTTVSYTVKDGGFGDQDSVANGVIVDPVAIYERSTAQGGNSGDVGNNGAGSENSGGSSGNQGQNASSEGEEATLSNTGSSAVKLALGALAIIFGGGLYLFRWQRTFRAQ